MSKRVKIRPLHGGLDNEKRKILTNILFDDLKIKFSRIVETGDCYVVVCLDENNVDHLIMTNSITLLRNHNFEVILPPDLRAKKCIVVRSIDTSVQSWDADFMKEDIQNRNSWAEVEEVYKMRGIPHMLKIRFSEISMARKACNEGFAFGRTHIGTTQIQMEEFIPLTPCWSCYKYDHTVKDCTVKELKFCSECGEHGHTFRDCTSDIKKCLNCDGNHRTLAAICPIRKELLKNKREEKQQARKNFETSNKTYCAVAKLNTELPKTIQSIHNQKPPQTVLNISDRNSLQIIVILVEAHLFNMCNPGQFSTRVNQLLEMNNFPKVNIPNDEVDSSRIFNVITTRPEYAAQTQDNEAEMSEDSSTSGSINISTTQQTPTVPPRTQATAQATATTVKPPQTATQTSATKQITAKPSQPEKKQQQRQTKSTTLPQQQTTQQQGRQTASVRPKEQRLPRQQQQQQTQEQRRSYQPTHRTSTTADPSGIGLRFYTHQNSGVLEFMAPELLYNCIKEGTVKYTYDLDKINEEDIIRYIRDGTLNTSNNKIKTVDISVFKKVRNGFSGSPPPTKQKQRLRYTTE